MVRGCGICDRGRLVKASPWKRFGNGGCSLLIEGCLSLADFFSWLSEQRAPQHVDERAPRAADRTSARVVEMSRLTGKSPAVMPRHFGHPSDVAVGASFADREGPRQSPQSIPYGRPVRTTVSGRSGVNCRQRWMVRRGSTVRVRQSASEIPCKKAMFGDSVAWVQGRERTPRDM